MNAGRLHRLFLPALLALAFASPARAALVTLTGKVTDQNSAGIFNVTINFVDSCTGVTAGAVGNVTSTTGDFRATVNAGVYDLEFVPPAGSLFYAWRIRDFDLTASRILAPVQLAFGVIVSGHVQDAGGLGVASVFVHFFPPGGSERTYTVRDLTDASGNFSLVVPAGTYDVKYGPPAGTRFLGLVRSSQAIPGNTTLATATLQTGLLVSGSLTDSTPLANPVVNANIDATHVFTGQKVFVSHDRTSATGAFTLAVPPGIYVFGYKPEKCNFLLGQESAATVVSADTSLAAVQMLPGVLVKGNVIDRRGAPVFDVNTNYSSQTTGLQIFTFDDHTDATGAYSAVIPAQDTYTVEYAPPQGVRVAGVKQIFSVNNNNTQTFSTVQLPDAFLVTGRARQVNGAPVAALDLDFFVAGTTSARLYTPNDESDATGSFMVAVEPGSYDIRFQPPSTTTLAAKRLLGVVVAADVNLGDVTILQGYPVSGNASRVDPVSGTLPVDGVDMDFFNAYTGEKAETPGDNTDCAGNYGVLVPAGIYNVVFVPPSCSATSLCISPAPCSLETVKLHDVVITSARSGLNAVLRSASLVSGTVRNEFSQPVAAVDLNFYMAGTGVRQSVSRDNTDANGLFGVFVPPGTYDIVFTPPPASGLAALRLAGVDAGADIDLGNLVLASALTPAVTSITPSSSPSSGGTGVLIQGANFQLGVTGTLGGLSLSGVQVLGPTEISAVVPAWPAGASPAVVDLAVTNVGVPPALLPQSFTYVPASSEIALSVARTAPNVVLSWPATGQATYTVFRSTSPALFGQGQILTIVAAGGAATETLIDYGADADGVTYFYRVE